MNKKGLLMVINVLLLSMAVVGISVAEDNAPGTRNTNSRDYSKNPTSGRYNSIEAGIPGARSLAQGDLDEPVGQIDDQVQVDPTITWDKTINGQPWYPGMTITVQTYDTIEVQEVLHLMQGPPVALWDQTGSALLTAGVSDYLTDLGIGAYSADDFQNDEFWAIDTIFVDGWDLAGNLYRASLLTWVIYPDAGGVPAGYPGDGSGTELWSISLLPNDPAVTIGLGMYDDVTLNVVQAQGYPLILPPGHYWLVFYPSLNSAPGRWDWRFGSTSNLNHPHMVDPTDYFGYGWTSWTDWINLDPTLTGMLFRLDGVNIPIVTQNENWDPTQLQLLDWAATGGNVAVNPGQVSWSPDIMDTTSMTLTKWFHAEPCTWIDTLLIEELWVGRSLLDQRPVVIHKMPPDLWLEANVPGQVFSGQPALFTLLYGNQGGFENDTMLRNEFSPEAPFDSSIPPPNRQDPYGGWAEWDIGDLPGGATGSIDVIVMVLPGLPPTRIANFSEIYDHTENPRDSLTFYLVTAEQVNTKFFLPLITRE